MTREERIELEEMESMFSTTGWKIFIKYFEDMLEVSLKNPDTDCKTNDEWQFRRGSISVLRYITGYEEMVSQILETSDA